MTTILSDIFGDTAIFNIDSAYSDSTLRGYIEPNTTKRAALQQIAFALGAVVDTSGTDKIKIFHRLLITARLYQQLRPIQEVMLKNLILLQR